MHIRPLLGLALATSTLLAQDPLQGPPLPPAAPAVQPTPQSPAEKVAELERRVSQLEAEIAFVRERAKQTTTMLRQKLHDRDLEVRSIDAGASASAPFPTNPVPMAQEMKRARLLTADELAKLPADVAMTVDGRPVGKGDIDRTIAYLGSFLPMGDDKGLAMRATLELVRIQSTLAQFPESLGEARQTIETAVADLKAGKPWSEVVQKYSRGPLQEDGKVVITRNHLYGLPLEMAAFAAEEGALTPIVDTMTGFAVLQVDKKLTGDTRANDRVEGRLILLPYHPDPAVIDAARSRAGLGHAEVAVRDDSLFEMLPPLYRPQPKAPPGDPADGSVREEVEQPAPATGGKKGDAPQPDQPAKGEPTKGEAKPGSVKGGAPQADAPANGKPKGQ